MTATRRHALAALALAAAAAGPAAAYPEPAQERPEPPRRTLPFPQEYDRPENSAGPVLRECEAGRILIGSLDAPRERGGLFSRDLREAPSFDGLPVQAPGFFRMQRAEDAIDYTRGRHGVLGSRDPYLLRGQVLTRTYKEKRPYWVPPGVTTDRIFAAGSISRTPFVRMEMGPRDFMRHLRGEDAHLTLILENPTDYFIPDLQVRLLAEPEHSTFPLERRMALEQGWEWEVHLTTDLGPLQSRQFRLRLPGKADPRVYREVESDVLAARRWPYPPLAADHPVRPELGKAGADLARLMPRRRLLITAGDITGCGSSPYPVVVRVDRSFRSFGSTLDGFDLEVLSAWSDVKTKRFRGLLNKHAPELPESLPPLLTAALHARDNRVPVQSRPGGYDSYDAMAHYLYGAIANADHGHTGFSSAADEPGADMDALARSEGLELPPVRRQELRDRLGKVFAGRALRGLSPEAAAGAPHAYPPEDDRLPADVHDGIYRPANDHVGFKAQLRENRQVRLQKLHVRYAEEAAGAAPKAAGGTSNAAGPKAAAPKAAAAPRSRATPAAPPRERSAAPPRSTPKPAAPKRAAAPPPEPEEVPEPASATDTKLGDFEDDFSDF